MQASVQIGITSGDLNGVGPELILRTLSDKRLLKQFTPVVYGSDNMLDFYLNVLDLKAFNFYTPPSGQQPKKERINVINCWHETAHITPGKPSTETGIYAFKALEAAVKDFTDGHLDALVTGPVNKHAIRQIEKDFTGHTEYLTSRFGMPESLMLLVSDTLRVGLVTNHLPLREVADSLSAAKIVQKVGLMERSLQQDFGIHKPKIAVLGLNPHAGDSGLLGTEEQDIITPAIEKVRQQDMLVFGPYSADGFFGSGNYAHFDGILAMYHDQGLAPFKALSFDEGVNFTAGLPVVRTSPGHGPAYDLAGKGKASLQSFRNALYLAKDIVHQRRKHEAMHEDVLQAQKEK